MLKTFRGERAWLITQSAHGELAGQLAAHWGNKEFATPGRFSPSGDPERVRGEVVFAVAEHDNGWWEWEADPPLSPDDGLPQGLSEVVADPVAGMDRWRRGIPRLVERHPYASVIIGDHAAWLYEAQFNPDHPLELTHQLQRARSLYPAEQHRPASEFVTAVREMEAVTCRRLDREPLWLEALEPCHRLPHSRLLQTLDALSLTLCSAVIAPARGEAKGLGEDHVVFLDVPRRSWEDRTALDLRPVAPGHLLLDPYPFDESPLTVSVPARLAQPHTPWRGAPWRLKQFTFAPPR